MFIILSSPLKKQSATTSLKKKSLLTKSRPRFINKGDFCQTDICKQLTGSQKIYSDVYCIRVNFTNVLRAAFKRADPKSAKKTVNSSSFCALGISARVKAAHRMLVKLTPDVACPVEPKLIIKLLFNVITQLLLSLKVIQLNIFNCNLLQMFRLVLLCCEVQNLITNHTLIGKGIQSNYLSFCKK